MREVFIVAATCTPFGRFDEILKELTAVGLGVAAIREGMGLATICGAGAHGYAEAPSTTDRVKREM